MWQDVIALTVVAVTVALTVRATVRSSARASNSACGDCPSSVNLDRFTPSASNMAIRSSVFAIELILLDLSNRHESATP